jgi:hypothetical protein
MKQIRINFLLLLMIGLIGCTKDVSKPNDENEHEAINKLELNFSEPNGVVKSFVVEDADGDGGNPPSRIDTILVKSGKQYSVTVKLYNNTNNVIKDVSSRKILINRNWIFPKIPIVFQIGLFSL